MPRTTRSLEVEFEHEDCLVVAEIDFLIRWFHGDPTEATTNSLLDLRVINLDGEEMPSIAEKLTLTDIEAMAGDWVVQEWCDQVVEEFHDQDPPGFPY